MVKFFQKAFSLAEMLIVLVIISIVVVFTLTLIKPDDSALRIQYYKAYNTVATAAYNIYEKALTENKEMYENEELCSFLKYYINTSSKYSCNQSYVDLSGSAFNKDNIQFTASNGMVFYMSRSFTTNYFQKEQKHRIIWVDINGKRRPNSAKWHENKPADIVAFDITDGGEVVPLGYPKIDVRYMSANVVYSDEEQKQDTMSFYKAQRTAFGQQQYEYEVFSYNFDQSDPRFGTSVLQIAPQFINKEYTQQAQICKNEDGELFPRCSLDIIK